MSERYEQKRSAAETTKFHPPAAGAVGSVQ